MAEQTKIQWTDHTFNHVRGCTKVSPGCAHCYADTLSSRNPGTLGVWGPHGTRVVASESYWREPLRWAKAAEKAAVPAKVFCASLADVFEDWQGPMVRGVGGSPVYLGKDFRASGGAGDRLTMGDVRDRLFALIEQTAPWLVWQLLTKRPENMTRMAPARWRDGWPANVWAMASVEDQQRADVRIAQLCMVPAKVRGLSVEPLLGDLDLRLYHPCRAGLLRWVIVGGESGHNARPCEVAWVRSLVAQCRAAGVAFFVKQLGARVLGDDEARPGRPDGRTSYALGEWLLQDPKGGDPAEWPEDMRAREFPAGSSGVALG